ncbi:Hypothetical protein NTJ_04242 [Nesidiocoris tenuis]|uniref:Uncharacterized protein n=1 Tax=Nesidiocoris tenuis TaxID=355587 RepID=A0ABN7AHK1_9HEMI|nr:Hypothetical protein NTJ_04242 [Nesidiocoris tenuis]
MRSAGAAAAPIASNGQKKTEGPRLKDRRPKDRENLRRPPNRWRWEEPPQAPPPKGGGWPVPLFRPHRRLP